MLKFFLKKSRSKEKGKVGGLFFFSSLLALLLVAIGHSAALLLLLPEISPRRALIFLPGLMLGGLLAHLLPQRWSVFLHEFKHFLPSHLVGNRDKGISVRSNGGEFRYAYSQESAKYNALISLAPYFVPLATIAAVPAVLLIIGPASLGCCFVAGIAAGFDLTCNFLDLGPHQSDLQSIRGGERVATWYVLLSNFAWLSVLLAWIMANTGGLLFLAHSWWDLGMAVRELLFAGLKNSDSVI